MTNQLKFLCYKLILYFVLSIILQIFLCARYEIMYICYSPYQKYEINRNAVILEYVQALGILMINYIIFKAFEFAEYEELEAIAPSSHNPDNLISFDDKNDNIDHNLENTNSYADLY